MTTFRELGLQDPILKALTDQKYETPTPIQTQTIPMLLSGRDLLGIAQTGTGKTAAFALPTLDRLLETRRRRTPRQAHALVLAPTRELAMQITESFRTYGRHTRLRIESVFGGVKIGRQIRSLQQGCDVLVATPGRLLDLMGQEAVRFDDLDVLILDEADQMLDLGFIHDLKKIAAALPAERQTLLFSATMPAQIADLSQRFLRDPARVSVAPAATTAERVRQGVYHVPKSDKPKLLEAVLADSEMDRALVFVRTKHGADRVVRTLMAKGLPAQAIHGNKSQAQRVRTLDAFRGGDCRILVATDIAARGIDVDGVSHVVNYEMPDVAEQYVHRIGRTARAGREGVAISLVAEDELWHLREVEKLAQVEVDPLPAPEGCDSIVLPPPDRSQRVHRPKGRSGGQSGRRRGRRNYRGQNGGKGRGSAPKASRQN